MTEPELTKTDILNATKGTLQKQLYAFFTKPTGGLQACMAVLEDHLAFQVKLEQDGTLFAAGPFWGDDEDTGLGALAICQGSRGTNGLT